MNDIAARPKISRVLIANRGEIALRAVRACRVIELETVAVFSDADADSPHVRAADRSVCIGASPSAQSYLAIPSLLHVAVETGCDAVYPGYGFLAENAAFAEACADNGLKFIGPSAEVIRTMGNKARARETARRFGVPVVPGSEGAFTSADEAAQAAKSIEFPLLLKARAGGGGRGMRIANDMAGFSEAFAQASRESEAAFGDGAIYLERFLPRVRHIEVQVLGDGRGNSLQMDERDCSIQRRHQKLVEESPSPVVDAALRARLLDVSGRLTRGLAYEGAGTVEFIFDETSGEFFFIEMNTRIQVEHPVTEMITGIDLIAEQIRIAAGEKLTVNKENIRLRGHAIEVRINAEDPDSFIPSPGLIKQFHAPGGLGVRFDSAIYAGYNIPPYYDSMVGKLIVHGRDREEAIKRLRRAIVETVVDGVKTTLPLHQWIIDQPDFLSGEYNIHWLEKKLKEKNG